VWEHIGCVIVPEKPMEGSPPVPDLFYCELCRLSRADPYVSHVFYWAWLACYSITMKGAKYSCLFIVFGNSCTAVCACMVLYLVL
jgi:hypothetical protein